MALSFRARSTISLVGLMLGGLVSADLALAMAPPRSMGQSLNPASGQLDSMPMGSPSPNGASPVNGTRNGAEPSPASGPGAVTAPGVQGGIDENYVLGAGDILQVNVFNVPEYSGTFRVATDGSISLPTIGRLSVQNLTSDELARTLERRFAADLFMPLVTVTVVEQRPLQISLIGEITQPGLYTLPANQGTQFPRLYQVLQNAGGVTQAANLSQVEVRRHTPGGSPTQLRVNLLALLEQGDSSQNIYLKDGDTVIVHAASTVEMANLNQLAFSNLRSNGDIPVDVAIVGEVGRPGPYRLGGEGTRPTIVQAIQQAGGITTAANLQEVTLRRRTRQGNQQTIQIDLWEMVQTGDLSQDLVLQTGDVLSVPTARDMTVAEISAMASSSLSTGSIPVNIIGEVERPGQLEVEANTSLNQALLSAGGLNNRARQQTTLIRFNPNGTVTHQDITVDLNEEVNSEANPLLQPNDVIVVGRNAWASFNDTLREFTGTFNLLWPFVLLGR